MDSYKGVKKFLVFFNVNIICSFSKKKLNINITSDK